MRFTRAQKCSLELQDERSAVFEVKLGGQRNIDDAAANLQKLAAKVSVERARRLASPNVVTAGAVSRTRPDGITAVALGHLGWE